MEERKKRKKKRRKEMAFIDAETQCDQSHSHPEDTPDGGLDNSFIVDQYDYEDIESPSPGTILREQSKMDIEHQPATSTPFYTEKTLTHHMSTQKLTVDTLEVHWLEREEESMLLLALHKRNERVHL